MRLSPTRLSSRDITHDDTEELPAVLTPEPDSWGALIASQADDEPELELHYWQMHYRPVETSEGERLGTALFMTEFPQLSPDFDDYIEECGLDDSIYPTEARTVEMAHFASEDDARKFETEFRSYLMPGCSTDRNSRRRWRNWKGCPVNGRRWTTGELWGT